MSVANNTTRHSSTRTQPHILQKQQLRRKARAEEDKGDWYYTRWDCCERDFTLPWRYCPCGCYCYSIALLKSEVDDYDSSVGCNICRIFIPCVCLPIHLRTLIRRKFGIPGTGCGDCWKTCACPLITPCLEGCRMQNQIDREKDLAGRRTTAPPPVTQSMRV